MNYPVQPARISLGELMFSGFFSYDINNLYLSFDMRLLIILYSLLE
jgi:hypothetical protein